MVNRGRRQWTRARSVIMSPRPIGLFRIHALRLLILLSAMITGLTGLIAGQPAVARGGEAAVVAAAFAAHAEPSNEVAQARFVSGLAAFNADTRRDDSPAPARFVPQTHKVDERRIE